MKEFLHVMYLNPSEKIVEHYYDIEQLKVGCINEKEYNFRVVEKCADKIVVEWFGDKKIEVIRKGDMEYAFFHDMVWDFETGIEYPTSEILSFCWIVNEEAVD